MAAPRLGAYTLLAPLARGASGVVYRGQDDDGNAVAVKVLEDLEPRMQRLFEQELRTAMVLDHPHVVPVLATGRCPRSDAEGRWTKDTPWLAMPYCPGGTVAMHPPADWPGLVVILTQTLEALAHAHARGVLHRDVKAANLLLDAQGDVLLADFGLSRSPHEEREERPVRGGTPGYVAPEQGQGRWWQEGPHSDLYGVGMLAWHLVAGALPDLPTRRDGPAEPDALGSGPQALDLLRRQRGPLPAVPEPRFPTPPGFLAWCRRMAAPEPSNRFALAADALEALAQLQGSRPRRTSSGSGGRSLRARGQDIRTPLVGRQAERTVLLDALRKARAGETRTVILRGPIGIGTTALARWIWEQAHCTGQAWPVHIRHDAHGRSPRFGVEGALRRALGLVQARPQEAHLRGVTPEDAELVWPRRPLGPEERRLRIREVLRGQGRPTLLWVDEVQWGLEALRLAAHWHKSDDPALIVLCVDPITADEDVAEALVRLERKDGVEVIDVGPLPDDAMGELVDGIVPLAPDVRAEVVRRVEGHPLYAKQWLQLSLDDGELVAGDGGYRFADPSLLEAPDAMSLMQRKLREATERLARTDRATVALAAALGVEVDRALWQAACEAAGLPTSDEALLVLQRRGLLDADAHGLRFAHPYVRDAVVAGLSKVQRLAFGQAGAAALEPLGIETHERRASLLEQSGQVDAAYRLLQEASRHWGLVDLERAASCIRQWRAMCVEHLADDDPRQLGPVTARARLSYVREDAAGLQAVQRTLSTLSQTTGSREAAMHASRTAARAANLAKDYRTATGHLERALAHCDNPALADTVRAELCSTWVKLGNVERALSFVEDPPSSADPHTTFHYRMVKAAALTDGGRSREALLSVEAQREEVERLGSPIQTGQWHAARAMALQEMGLVPAALEAMDAAIVVRRQAGFPVDVSRALRAGLLLQLGRLDDADQELESLRRTPLVEATRLAVLAARGDMKALREPLLALTGRLPHEPYLPRPLVRALERTGDEAHEAGRGELAAIAWGAAARGWRRLGSERRAERVRGKLASAGS